MFILNKTKKESKMKFLGVFLSTLIAFNCIFIPYKAEAEESEGDALKLNEVVVTATRKEKAIKDLPSSITVITRTAIEQSDALNVPELISEVPGVTVNGTVGDGSTLNISLRGVNPSRTNKILIMVNGVPMNNGWSGTAWWRDLPSPNQIERIEIIKGPVSALYGGYGIGGSINIITRRSPIKPETTVETSFGSNSERSIGIETGGNIAEKFSYQMGVNHRAGDGYRDRSAYEDYGASTKLGWMLTDRADIEMDIGYSKVDNEIAGRLTLDQYKEDPEQAASQFGKREMELFYTNLTFRQNVGDDDNIKATCYYHTLDYDYIFATSSNKDTVYDTYTTGGEIQYTLNHTLWGKKNTLIFGPSLRYDKADSKSYKTSNGERTGDPTVNSLSKPLFWAVYVQDEFSVTDPLTLTLGIRYDEARYDHKDRLDPSSSGEKTMDEFSPMLGLSYRFSEDTTLFGNVGKGFAPPTVSNLYGTKANPDLEPEIAVNYEVGIRTSQRWFDLTSTVYIMDIQDEIVSVAVNDDESKNVNAGETRHKGIETELDIKLPNGFTPFINYTYQNAEFTDYRTYAKGAYTVYDGKKVPNISDQILIAGIKYQHPSGLNYRLSARYDSEKYTDNANLYEIPGYTVWDTRIGYAGKFVGKKYSAYLSVKNLFDKNYYYKGTSDDVYPAAPRTFLAGVSFKF